MFAVAIMALETDKCHAYDGFVYGYGKDAFQHKFKVASRKVICISKSGSDYTLIILIILDKYNQ